MENPLRYDAFGRRRTRVVKAVVAARYENVSQTFGKLCLKFGPPAQLRPETATQSYLLDDALARLTTWGHETGAEDQSLDHKLRKSEDMRDTVLGALLELQSSLDEALQLLDDESLQDWYTLGDKERDGTATPPISAYEEGQGDRAQEEGPDADDTPTASVGDSSVFELLQPMFENIHDNVANLVMLGPSLERPYPQDIDAYSSSLSNASEVSDQVDIDRAKLEFPYASGTLQRRLGHANWKRRIAQILAQSHIHKEGKARPSRATKLQPAHHAPRQDVAQDAFNFQRPTLLPEPSGFLKPTPFPAPIHADATSTVLSDTTSLFDTDHRPSLLSRAGSATTLATMATVDSKNKQTIGTLSTSLAPASKGMFPPPPVPLSEVPKGKTELFTCNLCGYDLEAGGTICTDEDWYQHVLEDLEPYLCTFDTCFSAQETYSKIDEWYRHELESHRIKKTWACPACSAEFDTKLEATEHLVQAHGSDFPDAKEMAKLKAMLRQTLSGHTLGMQACPLCGIRIEASICKRHIGKHLEYFALLSLANDDDTSEEDSYPNDNFSQSDDGMSERGRKELFLNAFVTEQLKLDLQQGKIPPDVLMEGSNRVDLLDDMSDDGKTRDSQSQQGDALRYDPKRMLIDRMFRTTSADDTPAKQGNQTAALSAGVAKSDAMDGRTGTKDGTSRRDAQPAASRTSSSEKLPLLRTWSSPRNPDFMGRDKELVSLYKILSEPGRVCVLSGEGGMGKSALAVEYTWRFEQNYHYIFWVDAETSVGRGDTFCEIAQQLHLAPGGTDQDTLIRLGREFLEQVKNKRWLMVLDNVDRWEDIDLYTPTKTSATQGSILITTRHSNFTAPSRPLNYFRIHLEGLSVDEGRKLLLHGLPDELLPAEMSLRNADYKSAGDIASIGGLPLLILYISGYIKRSGCTLLEFWEYWNEWRANERLVGSSSGGGGGGGGGGDADEAETSKRDTVLHVTIGDLGHDEVKVLEVMAFLNSNGVQREVLEWNDPRKSGPPYLKKNRLRLIIGKLKGQKIVAEKTQGHRVVYTVHGLLLSKLMQGMNANRKKRNEIFGIAFDLIRNRLPRPSLDTPEQANWDAFREYLPLVLSLQRAYEDPLSIVPIRPFLGLAELFKDGGVLLWQRYIHGDALKLLHSAEKVVDELRAEAEAEGKSAPGAEAEVDDISALRCEIDVTTNLLLQYFGISYRKEIKERSAKILHYREAVFRQLQPPVSREDMLVVIDARADYANTLLQFNDFRSAEEIYQTCLAKYTELGTVGDRSTAFAVAKLQHHLAYCLMYRRAFDEALALAKSAVAIIEQVSDVAMTMRYRFDLGCIQLQSGALEQALDTQRSILAARLDFQGRASYFTLQSQYAVAALCHALGRLDEAEGLLRMALARATARGSKHFWPEAALARTKYHLSLVMAEQAAADNSDTTNSAASTERRVQRTAEGRQLAIEAKDVLSRMLPYDPEPILGVREEDTLALFDHLQPVFGGRFTSTKLLRYVSRE